MLKNNHPLVFVLALMILGSQAIERSIYRTKMVYDTQLNNLVTSHAKTPVSCLPLCDSYSASHCDGATFDDATRECALKSLNFTGIKTGNKRKPSFGLR